MKVLIINGNPKIDLSAFDQFLESVLSVGIKHNLETEIVHLREFDLHDCIGCYSCWLKTPGVCFRSDGMEIILKKYLAADVVVLASPIVMGFTSSLLKCFSDRLLPLIHPFLYLKEDRMGHVPRYTHYPQTVLILGEQESGDADSLSVVKEVYQKSSRDLKNIFSTGDNVEEVVNEIASY